jgi:hypothetical protein
MKNVMFSVDEVKARILSGDKLILSGDEQALRSLPAGTWIGGTTPYFMAEAGGLFSREQIYVTPLDDFMAVDAIRIYDDSNIEKIYSDVPENGFALLPLPRGTAATIGGWSGKSQSQSVVCPPDK